MIKEQGLESENEQERKGKEIELQNNPNSQEETISNLQIDQSNNNNIQVGLITPTIHQEVKSSVGEAGVNLFKSFIGSGILGLPYAFNRTGYLLGSVSMIFICVVVFYCCHLIFLIMDDFKKPKVCFQDLFRLIMGKRAVQLYNFFLVIIQIGVCTSYIIFFTEFFAIVFQTTNEPSTRVYYFLVSMCILTPLIMINNLHFFEKYSRAANIFTVLTLLVIMEYAIEVIATVDNQNIRKSKQNLFNFSGLAGFLGIAIYSFESIGTMFYIKQSMQEPEKFEKLFIIICFSVCLLNLCFSSLCAIAFGNEMNQIVLIGLEQKHSYFLIFQTLYALGLVFSYPLQFYPIIDNLKKFNMPPRLQYVIRVVVTLSIGGFSFIIPKFSTLLNLTGAFAGVALQFCFPIYTYHMYFRHQVSRVATIVNIFVVLFGLTCSIFSIRASIMELTGS